MFEFANKMVDLLHFIRYNEANQCFLLQFWTSISKRDNKWPQPPVKLSIAV
jgi:hypothetical protein